MKLGSKGGEPMCSIDGKGVGIKINRQLGIEAIEKKLPELNDRELEMVADFVRGLEAARKFLNQT